jgi:predicted metal-dependent hydrolase
VQHSAKQWAGCIGVAFQGIRIKNTKTRWGSCSSKGNLNFNWKLMMAPPYAMEYVVIHELCHLKHLNHSKAFWALVSEHMPDYKKAETWLKNHGSVLGFEG